MNYQNGNFYRVKYLEGIKKELKAPVTLLLGVMVTAEKHVKLQYVTKFDPESGSFIPIRRYYHLNGLTQPGSQ